MKHNILLVDDDAVFRKAMGTFLEDEGFCVKSVSSGDEALAVVRQKLISFSLALIDYHMPDATGPETIKKLKEHNPILTVLGLSGDDSVDAHNDSLESGAVFFMKKTLAKLNC